VITLICTPNLVRRDTTNPRVVICGLNGLTAAQSDCFSGEYVKGNNTRASEALITQKEAVSCFYLELLMFPKFMTPPNKNACCIVIAGLTRNPVVAKQWIPYRVRDDSC